MNCGLICGPLGMHCWQVCGMVTPPLTCTCYFGLQICNVLVVSRLGVSIGFGFEEANSVGPLGVLWSGRAS